MRRYSVIFFIFLIIISFITYFIVTGPTLSSKSKKYRSAYTIKSNPPNAAVYVDQIPAGSTPIDEYFVQSGDHRLRLEKEGYQPVDTLIRAHADERIIFSIDLIPDLKKQNVTLPAKKTKILQKPAAAAVLIINSDPAGARVWINDSLRGETPLKIPPVREKSLKIRIEKDGYLSFIKNYTSGHEHISPIKANLMLISGNLRITSTPVEASIFLDGEPVPNLLTPALLSDIPVGHHQIEISKPGYHPKTMDVQISRDKTSKLSVELLLLQGKLALQVRPWGSVYLNNELQKATSDIRYEIVLPAKQYELKVVHPTLGRWVKTITVEPDKELNITVDFSRTYDIRISAVDEANNVLQSIVMLDDNTTGQKTPAEIRLHTGIHRISVRKEGYVSVNGDLEIFIDSEALKTYKFILKKIE